MLSLTLSILIARGSGSVKADQWCSQLNILFVGLFVAWEEDGDIPDRNAPLSAPNTKNAAAHTHLDKLLWERLLANLLEKNPNASDDEIARVKSATMDRSLKCQLLNSLQPFGFSHCVQSVLTKRSRVAQPSCEVANRGHEFVIWHLTFTLHSIWNCNICS